jgi:hypothetical protein
MARTMDSTGATENELHAGNVVFSASGIAERQGARNAVFVAREAIRSVDFLRGPGGERIVVQLLFALVLLAIAFASVRIALGCSPLAPTRRSS